MRTMRLQFALGPGARRWRLVALAGVCVAAGAIVYANADGGSAGASDPAGPISTARPSTFRTAVIARLHTENVNYRWVACVASGKRFEGVAVVRCNVDFGEPHIVAYCSVLRAGRLLTSEDDPAIPCGHDNAGYSAPVVQYG